jgi:hypothetical protein
MNGYKPRRQTKRWLDADCPPGVLAIMDSGDSTADRYTIFYRSVLHYGGKDYISYRAASASPFSPHGIGLWCEMEAWQVAQYRNRFPRHKAKWSTLPDDVKRLVRLDLTETQEG